MNDFGSYMTAQNISTLYEVANKILRKFHACSADIMDGRKLNITVLLMAYIDITF